MLKSSYQKDPDFVKKINWPINGYSKVHGILYYTFNEQVRICVPNTPDCNSIIKDTLLQKIHTSLGHAGIYIWNSFILQANISISSHFMYIAGEYLYI